MTIQEQILAGLQTKFTGVDTALLTRIATKRAEGITDASQVNSIVEGINFTDVLNSYGDYRANGAVASAVQNYEKKHNLKDGKPIEEPNPNPQPNPNPKPSDDMATIIANAVSAAVKPLSEKLTQFEAGKAAQERSAQIAAKAKEYGIPESFVPMLKIADDADLDTFMKDAKQSFANIGFQGVTPPEAAETKVEKENDAIAKMISDGTKQIVEQKKD